MTDKDAIINEMRDSGMDDREIINFFVIQSIKLSEEFLEQGKEEFKDTINLLAFINSVISIAQERKVLDAIPEEFMNKVMRIQIQQMGKKDPMKALQFILNILKGK